MEQKSSQGQNVCLTLFTIPASCFQTRIGIKTTGGPSTCKSEKDHLHYPCSAWSELTSCQMCLNITYRSFQWWLNPFLDELRYERTVLPWNTVERRHLEGCFPPTISAEGQPHPTGRREMAEMWNTAKACIRMWFHARVEGHKEKDKPVKILPQRTSYPDPAELNRKIVQCLKVISYGLHSVYQLRLLPLQKSTHQYCMQNNILELVGKRNIFPPTNLDFRSTFFSLFHWKQTKTLNRTLQLCTECKAVKRWEMFHRVALDQCVKWSQTIGHCFQGPHGKAPQAVALPK